MAPQQDAVYATLVMTDSYLPGAMVLGHSLRDRGAKGRLAACVLISKLSQHTIEELQTVYDDIVPVEQNVNMQPANLYLMNRPDLISSFTKIELWRQTQYGRIVYLDADIVALRAPNELLTMDTQFAAVPDVGWPDCFNSGVMVLNPNMGDYYALQAMAKRGISFDGADQGLLNMHFTEWDRLSFTYNCTPNANYQYVPAYKHFQSGINMIHFIGASKPWMQGRDYKAGSSVYGELLGRWWAVYDRHYRRPVTHDRFAVTRQKVQDYVRGEETRYEPQAVSQIQSQPSGRRSSGYQITQPQPQSPPGIHPFAPQHDLSAMERPLGDQPSLDERLTHEDYKPVSTNEQRRFSAPHATWDPARQPPPSSSKPEAANFPSQQYEMSESKQLFEPPQSYPEPPKDMWYQVPQEKPTPTAPPRMIFPWEERAPKATRVFPKSRELTPPPQESEDAIGGSESSTTTDAPAPGGPSLNESRPRRSSVSKSIEEAFARSSQHGRPASPQRHVFPWEARAPKATRYFAPEQQQNPSPIATVTGERQSSSAVANELVPESTRIPPRSPDNPWDAFAQQSNKWDEDPDIARFMEGFNKPRRAPIQVVHDSRSAAQTGDGPPRSRERRASLKITDFPTEIERPSLPVTPAPIRRSTFWGGSAEEEHNQGLLPIAKGVPRQDEWVRRFTSQYLPCLPNPVLRDIGGILHLTCQHCHQQNPIIKLEELQRKQSLLMSGNDDPIEQSKTPPKRQMPESSSAEAAIEAAMRAMYVVPEKPKAPVKPILKEPHFEVTEAADDELSRESIFPSAHMTAMGHKSPTRFNPIILEGEAASERNSSGTFEALLDEEDETTTAAHHAAFNYSTSSLSPTQSRADLNADVVADDKISPTQVA